MGDKGWDRRFLLTVTEYLMLTFCITPLSPREPGPLSTGLVSSMLKVQTVC